jgi:hypothetical protein
MLVFVLTCVALTSLTSKIPKTPEGASNKKQFNLVSMFVAIFFPFIFLSVQASIQQIKNILLCKIFV